MSNPPTCRPVSLTCTVDWFLPGCPACWAGSEFEGSEFHAPGTPLIHMQALRVFGRCAWMDPPSQDRVFDPPFALYGVSTPCAVAPTKEQIDMRREAIAESDRAALEHDVAPDTIPEPLRVIDDVVTDAPGAAERREAVHRWWLDTRFRLAIRAALTGACLAILAACGGQIAPAAPQPSCLTSDGRIVPTASVHVAEVGADGAIRDVPSGASCTVGRKCIAYSAAPEEGRGSRILDTSIGVCTAPEVAP